MKKMFFLEKNALFKEGKNKRTALSVQTTYAKDHIVEIKTMTMMEII